MYRRRYWAVLGFEALLAFQILVTSLALVVASTILAAAICLVSIGLGGWLFWKLVRVMGRIQAGEARDRPSRVRHASGCIEALTRGFDRLSADGGDILRLHRDRLRPGRLCRRDPRRPAREKDRGGREGQGRRALPELRLHPRQGGAALGRSAERDPRGGGVRAEGRRRRGRLRGRAGAAREGRLDAHRRRRRAVQEEQDRPDRGRRDADRRGRRARRRADDRRRDGDPRHRLGPARDPGRRVRRTRDRHRAGLGAGGAARPPGGRRRGRVRSGDRLGLRPAGQRGAAAGGARARAPERGRRHLAPGRARPQAPGHRRAHRHPGRGRQGQRDAA